jgi:catechol 2,3-dioxygenase-like lactoylglutathione lyase family enzyme
MASYPGLRLRPTVHVDDLAASLVFYEQLGGEVIHGARDSEWVLMQLGPIQLILLARPPDATRGEAQVELTFGAEMPLDQLKRRLQRAGFPVAQVTTDRDFGDQLQVRTPDGLLVKISQRESDR